MPSIVTVQEAVSHIKDDDVLAISGMLFVAGCEPFYEALEERFLTSGAPRNLTMFAASSIGTPYIHGWPPDMANRLAHDGLVSKVVTSLFNTMPTFHSKVNNDEIEAYVIPQGTFSQMMNSAARRLPRTITRMGLNTFVDPRYDGGKLNSVSKDDICDLVTIDGEEFLSYKTIYPDVCIIRGSTIDKNGNITFEEECGEFDALQMAIATKNNGGTVIVQVKKQSDERANPQLVKLPAALIDYVYIYPRQSLRMMGKYDPKLNGADWLDESGFEKVSSYLTSLSQNNLDILNRACKELRDGDIVNLGVGIPSSIALMSKKLGMNTITFTNEIGIFGGFANFQTFGLNFNTDMVMSQGDMQNLYEGGGLDISFAGALEVDIHGRVNVLKAGDRIFGVGGFNSITNNAKTVVFCFDFLDKHNRCKIVNDVRYINFNASCKPNYQRVVYITERCTFELFDGALVIIDVNPKYDLYTDIVPYLPTNIKCNLKENLYGTICNCR